MVIYHIIIFKFSPGGGTRSRFGRPCAARVKNPWPLIILVSPKNIPLIILAEQITYPWLFWPPVNDTLGYSGCQNYTLNYSVRLKKTPLVNQGGKNIPLIIPGLKKDTLDYSGAVKKIPLRAAPRRIPDILEYPPGDDALICFVRLTPILVAQWDFFMLGTKVFSKVHTPGMTKILGGLRPTPGHSGIWLNIWRM